MNPCVKGSDTSPHELLAAIALDIRGRQPRRRVLCLLVALLGLRSLSSWITYGYAGGAALVALLVGDYGTRLAVAGVGFAGFDGPGCRFSPWVFSQLYIDAL